MRAFAAVLVVGAVVASGGAFADDGSGLMTGRSVAVDGPRCDGVTPVCATIGADRLVPYDNECQARADGASAVSFSGCFDEN